MLPLEDNIGDIIAKAQKGLGVTNEALASAAGITIAVLRAIKGGEHDAAAIRRIAPALGLGAEPLVAISAGAWTPIPPIVPAAFRMFTTPYHSMTVNAYLVWDPATRHAVVFDSGADASPILECARAERLTIKLILVTHAHSDHVMELPRLTAETGERPWVNALDAGEEDFPRDAQTFNAGRTFTLDGLRIETRLTSGHSAGQTTFLIHGLSAPIAVVGDSLFAGSMGGGLISYADQLRNNRTHIMTLADETILASGHGPLTTAGQERVHNPFFAA